MWLWRGKGEEEERGEDMCLRKGRGERGRGEGRWGERMLLRKGSGEEKYGFHFLKKLIRD